MTTLEEKIFNKKATNFFINILKNENDFKNISGLVKKTSMTGGYALKLLRIFYLNGLVSKAKIVDGRSKTLELTHKGRVMAQKILEIQQALKN